MAKFDPQSTLNP